MKSIYSDSYQSLLKQLFDARKKAGLSQAAFSERMNKPQSFVSKYERGERRLDVIEFLEVCQQLGADPHEIIKKMAE
ncbi:MAG: helix-turn-helix domain-containing protein [Pseudomonas sp.]